MICIYIPQPYGANMGWMKRCTGIFTASFFSIINTRDGFLYCFEYTSVWMYVCVCVSTSVTPQFCKQTKWKMNGDEKQEGKKQQPHIMCIWIKTMDCHRNHNDDATYACVVHIFTKQYEQNEGRERVKRWRRVTNRDGGTDLCTYE